MEGRINLPCSGDKFSSCAPCSALVDGVKIGFSNFCPSIKPAGIGILCTVPKFLYSDQAEPNKQWIYYRENLNTRKKAHQLDSPSQWLLKERLVLFEQASPVHLIDLYISEPLQASRQYLLLRSGLE